MNKSTPPRRGIVGPDVAAGVRPGAGVLGLARPETAAKPAPEDESSTEGTLIVGEGIHVKGEIEACKKLVVEGKVEASLEAEELIVRQGATYSGKATVGSARIDGRFDGELCVRGLLTIEAAGRVSGTLRYRDLKIEQGGRLRGDVDLLAEEAARPAAARRPAANPEERQLESAVAR